MVQSLTRHVAVSPAMLVGLVVGVAALGFGGTKIYRDHQKEDRYRLGLQTVAATRLAEQVDTYLMLYGSKIEGDTARRISQTQLAESHAFPLDGIPDVVVERASGVLHAQANLGDTHIETFCQTQATKATDCTSVVTDGTKVIGQINPLAAVAAQTPAPNALNTAAIDTGRADPVVLTTTGTWDGLPAGLHLVGDIDRESLRQSNLTLCIRHVIAADGSEPLKLQDGAPSCLARAVAPPSASVELVRWTGGRITLPAGQPFLIYSREK